MGSQQPIETFTLSECTPSDVPGMISVYLSSFASNQFNPFVFPKKDISDEEMHRWLTKRFTSLFQKRQIRTFKITSSTTGEMAAFLRCTFPHVLSPEEDLIKEEEKRERERVRKEEGYDTNWPRGANLTICDEKFGAIDRLQSKYVDASSFYVFNLLATSPKFQRKGLASRLLRYVLDMADREERKCYIEATPEGHPVYLRLGFRDLDIVRVGLERWGGGKGEEGTNVIMIRDPVVG